MSLPDSSPKPPQWIFFVTDAVLVAAAVFIATHSARPLAPAAVFAIAACVLAGAIVALVPLVARYEREKNEALDERQNALEALSRTVATSAEQISIAAAGLHEIAELAHKNLKQADQLPHKLQEKIAEFQAQLDNTREDDREELEQEIAELRAGENERLEAAADKVQKAIAELAKLEAAAQKHLADARQAVADIPARTASSLDAASRAAGEQLAGAQAAALAEIEARLTARTAAALAAIETALSKPVIVQAAPPAPAGEPVGSPDSAAPRRPRKPHRDEAAPSTDEIVSPVVTPPIESVPAPVAEPTPPAVETPVSPAVVEPVASPEPAPSPEPAIAPPASAEAAATVPAEVSAEPVAIPESEPVAVEPAESTPPPAAKPKAHETPPAAPAVEPDPKPVRKRTPKKSAADPEFSLGLELDEASQVSPDEASAGGSEVVERVISSDGATRLLVTAYIGIGNRLFIRGDGPGLSWDKGIPLQFVSIGKWRWETADAAAPVTFKLYKNDEIECSALGALSLEPGHQEEVSAKF